ncbi:hypothetical protein ABFS82_12G039300 [Erythranthe guttata]
MAAPPETSQFESTETLATFVAATPLLEESWRLCRRANAAAAAAHHGSFAVNIVGQVAYVAFSAVQVVAAAAEEEEEEDLVELENSKGVFSSSFVERGLSKPKVMVHAGILQLFLSFYHNHNFQQQILEISNKSKSIIFTGHSLGGAVASLSTLWLLSHNIQTPVLCITYGSPLLGNEPFSQAILQQRWSGNFCHIVAAHHHHILIPKIPPSLSLFDKVSDIIIDDQETKSICMIGPYWPFGSYMFITENGAICLDNATAIVEFLHLSMTCEGFRNPNNSCVVVEDVLKYEDYVGKICQRYLGKGKCMDSFSESSSEAGIALALASSEISPQEMVYEAAKKCLANARQSGWRRNLNNAKMAVSLAKINPCRAQLEWYKSYCDESDNELGYYDSFKQRGASRRDAKVNMNRIRLGCFWDDFIDKLENNHLTHDFHKLPKYVNASQFYKLLVEPLEIAEYYRKNVHREKGHYIEHGREKRFKIFDKWWRERKVGDEEGKPRSKYASLTQDSCFWARVEEARDGIYRVLGETDVGRRLVLLGKIETFEAYANGMIERKEVSVDVVAKNSSYNLFVEEWRGLKLQMKMIMPSPHFPGFQDGMVQ